MTQLLHPLPLSQLLAAIDLATSPEFASRLVTGIALDSRQVQPGNLFVALEGGSTDGHRYIAAALQRGAVAVVGSQPLAGLPAPYFQVSDGRRALARLSAAFQGFPAHRLTVIGVTGTDGKTTTSNLIYHILKAAGLRAGLISTVNALIGDQVIDTGFHVTTPEAPVVQALLARMLAEGLTHAVLESTSHGLAGQRVGACEFDLAVITNITHEHLDHHGSFEAYRAAKGRLFSELAQTPTKPQGNPRSAILNRDDTSYEFLAGLVADLQPPVAAYTYGLHSAADFRATQVRQQPRGLAFTAILPAGRAEPMTAALTGGFNLSNCLAAVAATVGGLSLPLEAARDGLAALPGLPGRMETIDLGQDFLAIVDFAHTPNALRQALEAARQLTAGRVIAVFGSAGLRDRLKRRLMAEIAVKMADLSVFTAEDPRTESLPGILAEMAAGALAGGGSPRQTFWQVPDRAEALRFAISLAQPGDVVIACGKGHEQSMCFGATEYPWDDRIAMRAALAERLGVRGPAMPCLPQQFGEG
jgi:UDP-N-acetylmuramoyl-L-alanyl-D-glutamate--2,6-diaminopimelate ligase